MRSCRFILLVAALAAGTVTPCTDLQGEAVPTGVQGQPAARSIEPKSLLAFSLGIKNGDTPSVEQLTAAQASIDNTDPMWPVCAFLAAETHRSAQESPRALAEYRDLARWAANDPYHDGWGASGLASVALWRWVQSLRASDSPDPSQVGEVLGTGDVLLKARLPRGMFGTVLLSSLPQLQEELLRNLAVLAWRVGNKAKAQRLLLDYFAVARTDALDSEETQIREAILSSQMASPERLTLYRGRCLKALGQREAAERLLLEVQQGTDPQARAEAALSLSDLAWITQRRDWFRQCYALLDDVVKRASDPEIVQEALLRRARFSLVL